MSLAASRHQDRSEIAEREVRTKPRSHNVQRAIQHPGWRRAGYGRDSLLQLKGRACDVCAVCARHHAGGSAIGNASDHIHDRAPDRDRTEPCRRVFAGRRRKRRSTWRCVAQAVRQRTVRAARGAQDRLRGDCDVLPEQQQVQAAVDRRQRAKRSRPRGRRLSADDRCRRPRYERLSAAGPDDHKRGGASGSRCEIHRGRADLCPSRVERARALQHA